MWSITTYERTMALNAPLNVTSQPLHCRCRLIKCRASKFTVSESLQTIVCANDVAAATAAGYLSSDSGEISTRGSLHGGEAGGPVSSTLTALRRFAVFDTSSDDCWTTDEWRRLVTDWDDITFSSDISQEYS